MEKSSESTFNWDYFVSLGIEDFAWDVFSIPCQSLPYDQLETKTLESIEKLSNHDINCFLGVSIRSGRLKVQIV